MKEKLKALGWKVLKELGEHVFFISAIVALFCGDLLWFVMSVIAAFYFKLDDIHERLSKPDDVRIVVAGNTKSQLTNNAEEHY